MSIKVEFFAYKADRQGVIATELLRTLPRIDEQVVLSTTHLTDEGWDVMGLGYCRETDGMELLFTVSRVVHFASGVHTADVQLTLRPEET